MRMMRERRRAKSRKSRGGHSSPTTTSRYDRRPEGAKRAAVQLLHVPYHRRPGLWTAEEPKHWPLLKDGGDGAACHVAVASAPVTTVRPSSMA